MVILRSNMTVSPLAWAQTWHTQGTEQLLLDPMTMGHFQSCALKLARLGAELS